MMAWTSKIWSEKAFLAMLAICVGVEVGCGDRQESFYSNLSEADKAGEITRAVPRS